MVPFPWGRETDYACSDWFTFKISNTGYLSIGKIKIVNYLLFNFYVLIAGFYLIQLSSQTLNLFKFKFIFILNFIILSGTRLKKKIDGKSLCLFWKVIHSLVLQKQKNLIQNLNYRFFMMLMKLWSNSWTLK